MFAFGGKMKKRNMLLYAAVLLLTAGTVNAALTVLEDVPGEKVVLDTDTGDYWIWDLSMFTNKTYDEQITDIAALGSYGGISSAWHMATRSEMDLLWGYSGVELSAAFNQSFENINTIEWIGRYDEPGPGLTPEHYEAILYYIKQSSVTIKSILGDVYITDDIFTSHVGAWATTSDSVVIPAPSALVLSVIGLTSLLGARRRRRRQ